MEKFPQQQLIHQLYETEKTLLKILQLTANALLLLGSDEIKESCKDQFEDFCVQIASIISQVRNGFLVTLRRIEENGINVEQTSPYPYVVSVAADKKKLELIRSGLGKALDLL